MSEVMLESGKGFGVGLRQRKREGVSDLRGVPRRRRKGDEGEAMAYGLRQIEENDIERLALMRRMGFTMQAALEIMQSSVATEGVPNQRLTPKQITALTCDASRPPERLYTIDARGRHSIYLPKYYEKLGHVWLTCPNPFPPAEVDMQMHHLIEKGFRHHEVERVRKMPHDRRTAIYFLVSNQTLPVRLDCNDILTSNDFETSEEDEHTPDTEPVSIYEYLNPFYWLRSMRQSALFVRSVDLSGLRLVKGATLRFSR
uniref:Uncharacterized protein n=1 Tax=Amorphochlora amoebiformis TaxID=1561963 RepID=A0A7S0DJ56_9EUKA